MSRFERGNYFRGGRQMWHRVLPLLLLLVAACAGADRSSGIVVRGS
jgi:hypothetical protein